MIAPLDVESLEQRDRALTTQAARLAVVAVAAACLSVAYPDIRTPAGLGAVCLLGLGFDLRTPVSLRNSFLLYTTGLFVAGGHLIRPTDPILVADLTVYLAAFLTGYGLLVLPPRLAPTTPPEPTTAAGPPVAADGAVRARIERLLWILALLQGARLALLMMSYGARSFYSGQELGDRISAYGQAGTTTQAFINIVLTALVAAATAVYARHCLRTGVRPSYWLLFAVLVAGPAISFQRAMLVYQGMLFVATYLCVGPVTRPASRPVSPGRSQARRRTARLVPLLVLLGAAVAATRIGDIRARELQRRSLGVAKDESTLVQVLRGEFTPIVFYDDVKAHIDYLGYRKGVNIVAALGTRFVPRAVWPHKPITSQEYYMRQLRPAELQAGFSLAPSLFGVGYLNFGLLGCALLTGIIGGAAAYFDRAYVAGLKSRVPHFLVVSTWFYSLMRDDLATSLASVLLTFAVYGVLGAHFAGDRPRPPDAAL